VGTKPLFPYWNADATIRRISFRSISILLKQQPKQTESHRETKHNNQTKLDMINIYIIIQRSRSLLVFNPGTLFCSIIPPHAGLRSPPRARLSSTISSRRLRQSPRTWPELSSLQSELRSAGSKSATPHRAFAEPGSFTMPPIRIGVRCGKGRPRRHRPPRRSAAAAAGPPRSDEAPSSMQQGCVGFPSSVSCGVSLLG